MKFSRFLFLFVVAMSLIGTSIADEPLPSQQRKLPDGSTEIHFSQSDGSRIKQVHRPDGTIEISSLDNKPTSNTIMLHHPDGTIEFRPKSMS